MIVVVTEGQRREFPEGARILTEDVFNNLCIHGPNDELLAVFAQDRWTSVEVIDG